MSVGEYALSMKIVYRSPGVEVLNLETEGVLCMSNKIPDWESNDDVL